MSKKNQNPTIHLKAGAVSGLMSCTLLQPFDLVKTRIQQQQRQHKNDSLKDKQIGLFSSTVLLTVKDIIEKDNISGLWKGTVPTILRNVPGSALYFFTLSQIRHIFSLRYQKNISQNLTKSSLPVLSNRDNLISGMIARGSIGFVMMPITVIKVRYESNFYNYKSIWGAFTSILRHEGVKGLYYGYGATAIRDAPYAGLYLLFYERWKLLMSANSSTIASPIVHMTSAIVAGLTATTITHPFDMLKTRVQLKPQNYPNIWLGALKIFKEEGFLRFFDGLSLRLGRKTTQAAINWTIYEALVTWLQQRTNENR